MFANGLSPDQFIIQHKVRRHDLADSYIQQFHQAQPQRNTDKVDFQGVNSSDMARENAESLQRLLRGVDKEKYVLTRWSNKEDLTRIGSYSTIDILISHILTTVIYDAPFTVSIVDGVKVRPINRRQAMREGLNNCVIEPII